MNPCFFIADRIHRRRLRRGHSGRAQRRRGAEEYWRWQVETSADYFAKFFDLRERIVDADVVDIGCGLGGRTCFLADQGARSIVGTDINHDEIETARTLAKKLGGPIVEEKVSFEKVSPDESTPAETKFDIALLVDSLEHVRDPLQMLNLAHSMLKPGGVCYFSTWGWYHHQASHVGSIVPIPFATLLFSDRQILDAVRRVVDQPYYEPSIWDTDPPSLRWRDCQSLRDRPGEYLNQYTIASFRRSAKASEFAQCELKVQGFNSSRHRWLSKLNFLTRVPVVQEVYHSALFGRMVRSAATLRRCA